MATILKIDAENYHLAPSNEPEKGLDTVSDLLHIADHHPPETLKSEDRVALGIRVLEKHGEEKFAFYQRNYRLTEGERELIFSQAGQYAKDLVVWENLDEQTCKEDVELVRSLFPQAKFSLFWNREENHTCHHLVEIDGTRYYFYSKVNQGPAVDEDYIARYGECQKQECRPDFKVLRGEEGTVFLMEFMGEKTPVFCDEDHLESLVELIVRLSLNKKGLDMLPGWLALEDKTVYCVSQYLDCGTFPTEIEAFKENIQALKAKIRYRGYAEEEYLLARVDELAKRHEIQIFEKTLDAIPHFYYVKEKIPPSSLNSDEKIDLVAAVLRKFGTRYLHFTACDYGLSMQDQKEARERAGSGLIENLVIWDGELSPALEDLRQKAKRCFSERDRECKFASYIHQVGNCNQVLTASFEGGTYRVSEVDGQYVEQYQQLKEREHRPDCRVFPLEGGTFLFLSKFVGLQTVDYSNQKHLDMLVDLAMNFSAEGKDTIDFSQGNLIVEGDRLFYIKESFVNSQSDNPRLANLEGIFHSVDGNLHTAHERAVSKHCVKNKISAMLDPIKDEAILKAFFAQ